MRRLNNGCSVKLRGKLVDSLGAKQDREFRVEFAEIVGECDPDKQTLTMDYLRDQCHLRARAGEIGEMLRIRGRLSRSILSYFDKESFTYVHTPIITSSDCEEPAKPSPFRRPMSLSKNLPKNTTIRPRGTSFAKRRILLFPHSSTWKRSCMHDYACTRSPSFHAERSQTSRHLAEFWMLQAEWSFVRHVEELCNVVEDVIKNAVCAVITQEVYGDPDIESRVHDTFALDRSWTRMAYSEAIERLREASASGGSLFAFPPEWGKGLQSEHEKWLIKMADGPVFVTDCPTSLKPFYMRMNEDDSKVVACFDLLVPGIGELVGGSLREERLELLDKAMKTHDLFGKEEYGWYRELRKYGGSPYGGFGLGFERLVSAVSGEPNVQECIAMPRWAGRILLYINSFRTT